MTFRVVECVTDDKCASDAVAVGFRERTPFVGGAGSVSPRGRNPCGCGALGSGDPSPAPPRPAPRALPSVPLTRVPFIPRPRRAPLSSEPLTLTQAGLPWGGEEGGSYF